MPLAVLRQCGFAGESSRERAGQYGFPPSTDPLDRLVREDFTGGTTYTYTFDPAGNVTGIRHLDNSGTTLTLFRYGYDARGLRSAAVDKDLVGNSWQRDCRDHGGLTPRRSP